MTTGNIIPAAGSKSFADNTKAVTKSYDDGNQKTDFMSFVNVGYGQNTVCSDIKNATDYKTDAGKEAYESSKTGLADKIIKKSEVNKQKDVDVDKLYDAVTDAVKEELGLTDEELAEYMAELGFTVADLLEQGNLAQLVAAVNNTDVTAILTDDSLVNTFENLSQTIDAIVEDFSSDAEIGREELAEILNQFINETESTDTDSVKSVIKNNGTEPQVSYDGKDIKESSDGVMSETVMDTDSNEAVNTVNTDNSEQPAGEQNEGSTSGELSQNFFNTLTETLTESISSASGTDNLYGVNQADIINQLIEAVKVNVTAETSSMEITLTPESLGKVNLNVTAKDGVITASITVQNEAVKNAIESQIIQLKENLDNQGLKVNDVEVTIASKGFDMSEQNSNQTTEENRSGGKRPFRVDSEWFENDKTDDEFEKQIMEINGNSVSYLA